MGIYLNPGNNNFKEITKDNKVVLFILKNNNIYLICYEKNQITCRKRITSVFDLNGIDADILIFKNLANVQIASIKKVLSKDK